MEGNETNCRINNQFITLNNNFPKAQNKLRPKTANLMNSLKRMNSLKWEKNLKSNKQTPIQYEPIGFLYYKPTKKSSTDKEVQIESEINSNVKINFNSDFNSKSSTLETKYNAGDNKDTNLNNPDISFIEGNNLNDSLIDNQQILSNDQISFAVEVIPINNSIVNGNYSQTIKLSDSINPNENKNHKVDEITSDYEGLDSCADAFIQEKTFVHDESTSEQYIYDDCIRIIRFLSEGAQAKIYIGLIEEIEKLVAIKRYVISHNEEELDRIIEECEIVKNLEHPNIIKYFDIEITNLKESEVENGVLMSKIDIIMEYIEGKNIKEYLIKNKEIGKVGGLPMSNVKLIARKILEGLEYLHSNKIIHRDLKPENILVNDDLTEIKIVDFGICTKVKDSETIRKRTALGTPYYMAPEVISEKPYAFEADIWSLGCIIYELVGGVKPYADMTPYNAMYNMVQYTSPLEYADEEIKDIFYDKCNRDLLDFLQKCWRPNNSFRPSASELSKHKFLIK